MARNALCAKIFYEIADILEIQDVQWKPIAYRKAARTIESLSEDVEDIYKRGGVKALMELPGRDELHREPLRCPARPVSEARPAGRLAPH